MFVRRQVAAVSGEFEKRFGIRFAISGFGPWTSDDEQHTLWGLLNDLGARTSRDGADVVIGFTAQARIEGKFAGTACLDRAVALVRMAKPVSFMKNVLKHELCHIFGGVDITEPGSIMDLRARLVGDGFDIFTAGMVLLHKNREFGEGSYFRLGPELDLALDLCRERHRSNPAEVPVMERLTFLYYAKKDFVALKEIATKILVLEPNQPGVLNLLGVAHSFFGDDASAERAFEEAARTLPEFPDVYLNLAQCRLKRGDDAGAEECYRSALKVLPADCEAHKLLGQLLENHNRPDEAIAHYRIALRLDPRLGQELKPRIRKLS